MQKQVHSQTDEDLWDKRRVAKYGGFSIRKIDHLIQSGRLGYVKVGKNVRFIPDDVRNFIRSCRIA